MSCYSQESVLQEGLFDIVVTCPYNISIIPWTFDNVKNTITYENLNAKTEKNWKPGYILTWENKEISILRTD